MAGSVYVVDDDEAVRDSLREMLSIRDLDVVTYPSAYAFVDVASTLPDGVVISDVRMPGNGLELQRLLAIRFPIIIITGHGDAALAVRAMRGGAVDFLEKPVQPAALVAAIEVALSGEARLPHIDLGPDETIPNRLPERLRALSRQWLLRAADPLNALDNNPAISELCAIAATALWSTASELERAMLAELIHPTLIPMESGHDRGGAGGHR